MQLLIIIKVSQSIKPVYVAEGQRVPHGTVSGPFEFFSRDIASQM